MGKAAIRNFYVSIRFMFVKFLIKLQLLNHNSYALVHKRLRALFYVFISHLKHRYYNFTNRSQVFKELLQFFKVTRYFCVSILYFEWFQTSKKKKKKRGMLNFCTISIAKNYCYTSSLSSFTFRVYHTRRRRRAKDTR